MSTQSSPDWNRTSRTEPTEGTEIDAMTGDGEVVRLTYHGGLFWVSDTVHTYWVPEYWKPTRVDTRDFRPGDLAEHSEKELDPREVVAVGRDWITLDIFGTETERLPRDNYTVYTEAEGAL